MKKNVKKRKLISLFVIYLGITIGITALAMSLKTANLKKTFKPYQVGNEIALVQVPNQEEMQNKAEYIEDLMTQGKSNVEIQEIVGSGIDKILIDGENRDYQIDDSEDYLLKSDYGEFLITKISKNSNIAIFMEGRRYYSTHDTGIISYISEEGDFLLVNGYTNSVEKLSSDKVEEFDKEYLQFIKRTDMAELVWTDAPRINEEHTLAAYVTNRRGFDHNQIIHYDLWIIDLISGEERMLLEDASPLFIMNEDIYYVTTDQKVGVINLNSKISEIIIDQTVWFDFNNQYFSYRDSTENSNQIWLYNYFTGSTACIEASGKLDYISLTPTFSPNMKKCYLTIDRDIDSTIYGVIVDLEDNSIMVYDDFYKGYTGYSNDGWLNNNSIVLTLYKGNLNESKIIYFDEHEAVSIKQNDLVAIYVKEDE